MPLFALPPGVTIESAPLFPWPPDPVSWLRGALLRDGETPGDARTVGAADLETALGWPLRIFEVDVGGARRLVALYQFLEWGGAVLVLGALDDETRPAVVAGLRRAHPDFASDEAICVADVLPRGGAAA